jgi:hypothetical protein
VPLRGGLLLPLVGVRRAGAPTPAVERLLGLLGRPRG